jgi:hypothetical protein
MEAAADVCPVPYNGILPFAIMLGLTAGGIVGLILMAKAKEVPAGETVATKILTNYLIYEFSNF